MSDDPCQHDWLVWNEGLYLQHRRCRKCDVSQEQHSLLPLVDADYLEGDVSGR